MENTMIVMDSFASLYKHGYKYISAYLIPVKEVENVGSYHNNPDYWLFGIDVQLHREPFVAILIDPIRAVSSIKWCLEAFRTYLDDLKSSNIKAFEYELNKNEDFDWDCKRDYPLKVKYFKSELKSILLDVLLNKYWMNTLNSFGLLINADCSTAQMYDLSGKLEPCKISLNRQPFIVDGAYYISWACTLRIRSREKH